MRLLTVTLQLPMHPGDIRGFRSAIAALAGHKRFHHHDDEALTGDGLIWEYPLIQYGVRRGKAVVIGLGEGAQWIRQHLLPVLGTDLEFAGRRHFIAGYLVQEEVFSSCPQDEPYIFGIRGWLALNPENYASWKQSASGPERQELLSGALTGHLRAFGEGLGVERFKEIAARILSVDNQKKIRWHGAELICFHVLAEANLHVPAGIGIGRAAAYGFGEVMTAEQYRRILHYAPSSRNEYF